MIKLNINGQEHEVDVAPEMPLLWVLRDEMGMTGTKFGCGIAQCGACTVHIAGSPMRSCSIPVGSVWGPVVTIEGIGQPDAMHVVQQAWVDHQVAQCGYCQSGQIMSAVGLLETNLNPSDEEIESYMAGNLCRCGVYPRIKAAIKQASAQIQLNKTEAAEPAQEAGDE